MSSAFLANLFASVQPTADATQWPETVTVLVLSFGLAALAGFMIDAWFRSRDKVKPDVDAYIDQLIAGNGTRVHRSRH